MAPKTETGQNTRKSSGKGKRGGNHPENVAPYQWKPGQSGNPGGRPKGVFRTALLEEVMKVVQKDPNGRTLITAIAQRLAAKALAGDLTAIAMIADRTDGKPTQAVTLGGEGGGAIPFMNLTPEENEKQIAALLAEAGGALVTEE